MLVVKFSEFFPLPKQLLNALVVIFSVLLCLLLLPSRLPGMSLLGITPNWLLIWVVSWSMSRSLFQGALAGVLLGLIQDSMTNSAPTHVYSLALVGILTSLLQKQRYIQEDFISVALMVFFLSLIAETVTGIQYIWQNNVSDIWDDFQRVALCSAVLSSLWAPVLYYPLHLWWRKLAKSL